MHRFFLKLFRRRKLHEEMEAELALHRDMGQAEGNPIGLGNTTLVKENALDLWRFTTIENWWRDLVYAARGLKRSPGFLLSALLSLGLGIGVNTALFSLAVEFLLSEPSVRDAGSIIAMRIGHNSQAKPEAIDFLRRAGVFEDVIGEHQEFHVNWNDGSETRRLFALVGTQNYFDALDIPLLQGRGWTEKDPADVAVLSYRLWRNRFRSDPSVVGGHINVNGKAYTVLGILPEKHRTLAGFGFAPEIYVPRFLPDTGLTLHARMKPGMTTEEALAALKVVGSRMDVELPQRDHSLKYSEGIEVWRVAGFARLLQKRKMMPVTIFFAMLLLIVGLVLLIACVNVASLLLARAAVRQREIGVRLSLGASRGRLMQQLLAESLLLSLLGAAAGVSFAQAATRGMASIPLPLPVPIVLQAELDWRVMLYAAMLVLGATIACGLVPALQSVKQSLASQVVREPKLRLRKALVAFQISVSVVVLATGFLFVRNLLEANSISPGFDVRRTVRAEVHMPKGLSPERNRLFVEQALGALATVPGIEAAAAARIIPFTDSIRNTAPMTFAHTGQKNVQFQWNAVTPDYFRAMDIPIVAGSTFAGGAADEATKVIVNTTFARVYLDGRNAVGTTFLWGDSPTPYEISGVVADTKNNTIGEEPRPQLYQPLSGIVNDIPRVSFVMRSVTPPVTQLAPVRSALQKLEPGAAVEATTLYSSIGMAFLPSQIGAGLLGSVGLLGLLLAAIGLWGVCSYSVAQRTQEIGLRMAIGATRAQISLMVLADAGRLIGAGAALGIFVALFVTRPLAMFFVEGLSTADPLSYGAVLAVFAVVGLLATLGPLRRAVAVDPASSLRYE